MVKYSHCSSSTVNSIFWGIAAPFQLLKVVNDLATLVSLQGGCYCELGLGCHVC